MIQKEIPPSLPAYGDFSFTPTAGSLDVGPHVNIDFALPAFVHLVLDQISSGQSFNLYSCVVLQPQSDQVARDCDDLHARFEVVAPCADGWIPAGLGLD